MFELASESPGAYLMLEEKRGVSGPCGPTRIVLFPTTPLLGDAAERLDLVGPVVAYSVMHARSASASRVWLPNAQHPSRTVPVFVGPQTTP